MEPTLKSETKDEVVRRREKPLAATVPVRKKSFDPWRFLATICEGRRVALFNL
jgi:hypothetical protein